MDSKFLNLGVGDWRDVTIHTLGPNGTSSEAAAGFFSEWFGNQYPGSRVQLNLSDSYEHARSSMSDHSPEVLIVANAYPQIHNFYMDPRLSLVATFVFDTPLYGLVSKGPLATRKLTVATHPAPLLLVDELLPQGLEIDSVILALSTSAAAAAAARGEVDVALTTEVAANIHGLNFISNTRPIRMLWSVFMLTRWSRQPTEVNLRCS
ncbi:MULTISPECIES: bacilysin biosynthesis protein BacA [Pseudomonadaceae]|uniref:bacilysin biosynthesis protein BacA n=1 Tax=Pseudomonadaceae TaxID=135621 RepID=UPI0022DDB0F7|nr:MULTISPECIES: bacilysin biosynthesis protein BacA [Pseudomonas aeruginosa group]ELN4740965.1 bacilysin biosynthesis protein BacA [Escherichia coli]WBM06132.1 bacilysin biosynthesis protein BacA [Pseudomonas aeruginosa]WBM07271.1 bacilysin biosynthesis protein BacA [Pseudomonas aeruginosa]WBM10819.1 bacilysin biosynthesis protein BacA [Pseudomonas aeruginosa]